MKDKPFIDRLLSVIKELTEDNKKKFAEMLGVRAVHIDHWVNRGSLPSAEHLKNFQQKLNLNINWLLTGEGPRYLEPEEKLIIATPPAEYYSSKEKEYIDKLVEILQTKDEETQKAIMQNIDTFLRVPSKTIKKTKLAG